MIAPIVTVHNGIHVVRDDLFLGGTKARFLPVLFDDAEEVVYASPCEGGAQTADVLGATIHKAGIPFSKALKEKPPFPSDPHYDAKAWKICKARHGAGLVLFWNVTGPATA